MRRGRHRTEEPNENFARGFNALGELALDGVQVSARATDLATGKVLFSVDDHVVMPTASIGKVLLLVEVASRLNGASSDAFTVLDRAPRDSVGDSGIWQHMQSPSLPLADLAALIGATSDNLATNVLIRYVGLEAVRARTETLGLTRTALLDLVRDHRGPDDAPQLSIGSAKELTWLFASLARGEIVEPRGVAARGRLAVAQLRPLDGRLARSASTRSRTAMPDHGVLLMNKTGTDGGVRSEVGVLRGPRASVAYAVSMYFADTDAHLAPRGARRHAPGRPRPAGVRALSGCRGLIDREPVEPHQAPLRPPLRRAPSRDRRAADRRAVVDSASAVAASAGSASAAAANVAQRATPPASVVTGRDPRDAVAHREQGLGRGEHAEVPGHRAPARSWRRRARCRRARARRTCRRPTRCGR